MSTWGGGGGSSSQASSSGRSSSLAAPSSRRPAASSTRTTTTRKHTAPGSTSLQSSRSSHVAGRRREKEVKKHKVCVLDPDTGDDVTPLPLLGDSQHRRQQQQQHHQGGGKSSTGQTISDLGSESGFSMSATFSRMDSEASMTIRTGGSSSPRSMISDDDMQSNWDDSMSEASTSFSISKLKQTGHSSLAGPSGGSHERRESRASQSSREDTSHLDPEELLDVLLQETETDFLFEMASLVVPLTQDEEATAVRLENEAYEETKRLMSAGSERFSSVEVQTFNRAKRSTGTQEGRSESKSVSINVSNWEIFDAMRELEEEDEFEDEGQEGENQMLAEEPEGDEDDPLDGMGSDDDEEGDGENEENAEGGSSSKGVPSSLSGLICKQKMLERVIVRNNQYWAPFEYKNVDIKKDLVFDFLIPEPEDETHGEGEGTSGGTEKKGDGDTDESDSESRREEEEEEEEDVDVSFVPLGLQRQKEREREEQLQREKKAAEDLAMGTPTIVVDQDKGPQSEEDQVVDPTEHLKCKLLWKYEHSECRGRTVSIQKWNKHNKELLAVGYSASAERKDGRIMIWSIKNIQAPERIFVTPFPVVSMDFSNTRPSLLAAGLSDGSLVVFDLRKDSPEPALECSVSTGKHLDTVWDVNWILREGGIGERLVSVSSDGLVYEWNISKGLEASTELNRLKRIANPARVAMGTKADAFISRQAGGMSLDFSRADPNMYLVGTEEGTIHKCSVSYAEQYLENFFHHTAAVYRVRWSPFSENYFLSCSADWSIALWNEDGDEPLVIMEPSKNAVNDVCWSPFRSTVFASATVDGIVQLWDIKINTIDPVKRVPVDTTAGLRGGTQATSVLFSETSPILLIGDSLGLVSVYKLEGFDDQGMSREEQQQDLATCIAQQDSVFQ